MLKYNNIFSLVLSAWNNEQSRNNEDPIKPIRESWEKKRIPQKWHRRKRGVKRKRPINIPEYAEDFSGDEYNDITEKESNYFGESENDSDESGSPYSKINTHTMDSCICYSTCNDTEQHSTYCAAENAFEYQDRFDSDDEYLVQRICDMDEDAGINDI